jgi:hypothetical protein
LRQAERGERIWCRRRRLRQHQRRIPAREALYRFIVHRSTSRVSARAQTRTGENKNDRKRNPRGMFVLHRALPRGAHRRDR